MFVCLLKELNKFVHDNLHVEVPKEWQPLKLVPPVNGDLQYGYAIQSVVGSYRATDIRVLLQFAPLVFDPPVICHWKLKKEPKTGVYHPWQESTEVEKHYWYPSAVDMDNRTKKIVATLHLFDPITLR